MNSRQLDDVSFRLLNTWIQQQSHCHNSCRSGGPTATMPSQQPPTPPTSESGSDMSSRASTTELQAHQTTPLLKRKREKPIVITNDIPLKEEQYFLDDQAMERVADLLTREKWINDDCIDKVLEVFNPDPAVWYVASTHLVSPGDHSETGVSKHKSILSDPPRKLMFPLHLPSMSHWTLVVYDRKQKRCLVYDPMGSMKCNELALSTVQKFLSGHGLWDGDVTIDTNPFPSMRQIDSINCGIFVIAVGLHLLHGRSVESITPRLWRELLAAYFCNKSEPPRDWVTSYLTSTTRSADGGMAEGATIERKIEDAEAVSVAVSYLAGCLEEIQILLELVEMQVSTLEKREQERNKLIEMRKWCLGMPAFADRFTKSVITARGDLTVTQLKAMPRLVRGGVRQLQVLKKSCSMAMEDFKRVSSALEQRKNDLRDEAMNAYHSFGTKLAALEK